MADELSARTKQQQAQFCASEIAHSRWYLGANSVCRACAKCCTGINSPHPAHGTSVTVNDRSCMGFGLRDGCLIRTMSATRSYADASRSPSTAKQV